MNTCEEINLFQTMKKNQANSITFSSNNLNIRPYNSDSC
jgi:hypothetical protein